MRLQLRDTNNVPIERSADTNITVLLTEHTYTIPGPLLEPKDRRFVGYEQPYTKIHYELDFSRGAEVDIGCGTAVVGDSTEDGWLDKSNAAHPLSMQRLSFNFRVKGETGYYPQRCPRYHRFKITRAGNFTFVRGPCSIECLAICAARPTTPRHPPPCMPFSLRRPSPVLHIVVPTTSVAQNTCGSMETIGVGLYRQTSNISESEQRVVPITGKSGQNKRNRTGQIFEVPLHDNKQQYKTMSTGLIRVQAEPMSKGFTDWMAPWADPDYPPMEYPDHAFWTAINGCPLSIGANRTYHLATGSYILETMGADLEVGCTNFIVSLLAPWPRSSDERFVLTLQTSRLSLDACVCVCACARVVRLCMI